MLGRNPLGLPLWEITGSLQFPKEMGFPWHLLIKPSGEEFIRGIHGGQRSHCGETGIG